jgi:tetratricopeptide (TPR) repeat protein
LTGALAFAAWLPVTILQNNAEQMHKVQIQTQDYKAQNDFNELVFGKFDDSRAEIEGVLEKELFPEQGEILRLHVRNQTLIDRGHYAEALAGLDESVRFDFGALHNPKNEKFSNLLAGYCCYSLSQRGFCHYMLRQYDKGIEDMTQCIKLDPEPKHKHFYVQRAEGYKAMGNDKLARADMERAKTLADEPK